LAQSVLEYIRRQKFLKAGDRAGIAVSGGADSVALLRVLLELRQEIGVVLSVVHFNHNLRGTESDEDERFVAGLAMRHDLEFHVERGDVKKLAGEMHLSTEAAARELRYQFFLRVMAKERLNCIATGHTLDDQAETVLLKVVRGSGTRGLAGIYPRLVDLKSHAKNSENQFSVPGSLFSVVRPLLGTQRAVLEAYLRNASQSWREDSSNRDLRYGRNRVRHGIVPRLERTLNPRVKEALAETAEIARAEEEYWKSEVQRALPAMWNESERRLAATKGMPLALARRVVRGAAESLGVRLEFRQVEEILGLAKSASAMLPGWVVSRSQNGWQFEPERNAAPVSDYEYALPVPGMVQVPEAGSRFEVTVVPGEGVTGYNPDHVFDPALLQQELTVRNWRAGDRFWPAHTKSPKKVKELLQERKLAERERKLWPVVVSGEEIVWVRGFPGPARLRHRDGAERALVIQEHAKP
jgi:tRNA(Ile)-lysidine synthase